MEMMTKTRCRVVCLLTVNKEFGKILKL